jgi:hypothetical protein
VRTDCREEQLAFQGLGRRAVVADFSAGRLSSDAGGLLLLREVAERSGLLRQVAACFLDHRDPALIEHTVEQLVSQRVLALACGYEDLNDHDVLRDDALLAAAAGKRDVTGAQRRRTQDRGHALAGKSTLNRWERTPADATAAARYHKIVYDPAAIERVFVEAYLAAHPTPPAEVILDLDATDDPLHGQQEGRFFHGYYRSYCYLPLYVFAGDFLLAAQLRRADGDGAAGAVEVVERLTMALRARWPAVRIIVRADSGFARDALMTWCEAHGVDYVLGLARNDRLEAAVALELALAALGCAVTQAPVRLYKELVYQTRTSWTRARRVVGKAEHLPGKANPRFVVTSLGVDVWSAPALYETLYCARGDMENRIKEQQLGLFADRTSTATMRANQLRLWLSSVAYVLVHEMRRVGLRGTALARAQVSTIRTRLFKLGGVVRVSVRRLAVALSGVFPLRQLFVQVLRNLQAAYPLRC